MIDRDDVLIELDAALDVEPSAVFAEGVRARVAHSRVRTRRMWWGLAAAASVTLATVALWRPAVVTPAIEAPVQVQADARATMSRSAVPEAGPAMIAVTHVRTAAARAPRVEELVAPSRLSSAAASEPRLEVITNQPAVLREMWAGRVRALPEAVVEVESPNAVASGEPKPIAPIVVDPIVVAPLVVSEIGTTGGRGGVTPGIRRVDAAGDMR